MQTQCLQAQNINIPGVGLCTSELGRLDENTPPEGTGTGGCDWRWNSPFRDCAMGAVLLDKERGLTTVP